MSLDVRTRIIGTGSYKAEKTLTNLDLEKIVDTSDQWIVERTGIRERRIAADNVSTSDMAAHALKEALDLAGKKPNDLDMIICGTVTPDRPLPSTASYVQRTIGASNNCPCFDLSAACAGFIYGLSVADSFIRSGNFKTIGVIGTEMLSRSLNMDDRNTCVLFGDGAGAVVVNADTSGAGIISTHLFTDGSLSDILTIPAGGSILPATEETVKNKQHCITMEGKEVYRCAVKYLSSAATVALESNNITADDVNLVVAHQANIRIIEGVARRISVSMDKFVLNIERFGNTSSASIPLALDEAVRDGRVNQGDTLLMIALGGGISWGSSLLTW